MCNFKQLADEGGTDWKCSKETRKLLKGNRKDIKEIKQQQNCKIWKTENCIKSCLIKNYWKYI